jgi:hypothetical protein
MIHSAEFLEIVKDAMSRVRKVSVDETQQRMKAGAILIDVRDGNEFGAAHAKVPAFGRGIIERDIVGAVPTRMRSLSCIAAAVTALR